MVSDRRSRSRGVTWAVLGALGVVVLAVAAWLGWSWLGTYHQAQAASASLTSIRQDIASKDWVAAVNGVAPARAEVDELAAATDRVPWRVLAALPWIGPTAGAVNDLADAASGLLAAAEPLAPYAQRIVGGDLRRTDGTFDVTAIAEVTPLLQRFAVAADGAGSRLASVDLADVRPEVADPLTELRDALADAAPAISDAATAAARLPGLLGADGERSWLVLLQNPAEARGSGGFVGGYVVIRADGGRLTVESTGTSADLATTPIPEDAATEDERVMWGKFLTAWSDYNLSPDFPFVARLSVAGMKARGVDVDGVVAIDPAVVAAIMRATGPVDVDGRTLTADDVERFFLVDVYAEYPDPAERDRVSMAIVGAVLQRVLDGGLDLANLADSLRAPVDAGRVRAWSADSAEEEWLATTGVGGVLPQEGGPVVAVTFNNSAGNKMDAFVATTVDYEAGRCSTASMQQSLLRVTLRNDSPAYLPGADDDIADDNYAWRENARAPRGSTSMLVHLYPPVGSEDETATLDGQPLQMYPDVAGERLAWWAVVPLDRGKTRTIELSFREPSVLGVAPRVVTQPMAIPTVVTTSVVDGC